MWSYAPKPGKPLSSHQWLFLPWNHPLSIAPWRSPTPSQPQKATLIVISDGNGVNQDTEFSAILFSLVPPALVSSPTLAGSWCAMAHLCSYHIATLIPLIFHQKSKPTTSFISHCSSTCMSFPIPLRTQPAPSMGPCHNTPPPTTQPLQDCYGPRLDLNLV